MSAPVLGPVVRLGPAKVNLTLAVLGRRRDGFHDLHSVVARTRLADVLTIGPGVGPEDSIHVVGHDPGPPEANLVIRAIEATRRAVGPALAGPLAVRLVKTIPVAAGLGGGSSDAAAAIDGALAAWRVTLDDRARREVALGLGSDVPLFLVDGWVVVEGRGERVRSVPPPAGSHRPGILLVTPPISVRTADVYAAYAAGHRPANSGAARATSEHLAAELGGGLTADQLVARAGVLAAANDLIPATLAIAATLEPFRRSLRRALGRPVGQSGSGPTSWALYPSIDEAQLAAAAVRAAIDAGSVVSPGGHPSIVATTLDPDRSMTEGDEDR